MVGIGVTAFVEKRISGRKPDEPKDSPESGRKARLVTEADQSRQGGASKGKWKGDQARKSQVRKDSSQMDSANFSLCKGVPSMPDDESRGWRKLSLQHTILYRNN